MKEIEHDVYNSIAILQNANKLFIRDATHGSNISMGEWRSNYGIYKTCHYFIWLISDEDIEPPASMDNVYEVSIEVEGFTEEHRCTFVGLDTDAMTKKLIEIMDGLAYEA